MAPIPIRLLISGTEPGKIIVLAMIFLSPHAIRLILAIVPCVFVFVSGIAIAARIFASLFLSSFFSAVLLGECGHE